MQKESRESSVFDGEYKILQRVDSVLRNPNITAMELADEYRHLAECYRQLLGNMDKVARISDINQRKLFNSHEEVKSRNELLYRAATTDELTEIYNRSYVVDFLEGAFYRSQRYQQVLSCILIDIDDFKRVNDTYGHLVGDTVLMGLAGLIKQRIRSGDVFGRYGGEEFMIVLPNTTADRALQLAEEVRAHVADASFAVPGGTLSVTVSIGVAENDGLHAGALTELIHQADVALYRAKGRGKDCAVLFRAAEVSPPSGGG